MLAFRHAWVCLGLLGLSLLGRPALAQSSVASLRAAVEEARGAQSGTLAAGTFESLAYQLDVAEHIEPRGFALQAEAWRKRAQRMIDTAKGGHDPFLEARGQILMRGYRSPVTTTRQGYAIYLPKNYDPARAYPLVIALHGGSANGNLFLGVVLGNNMNWKLYDKHLWDAFEPRWTPDCIVVAPDGFGQIMWRFMGEQDVLDVLDDVKRHYHVDEDRVTLLGLSNGGVGAYSLGMRHAWRFNAVIAIAGAPSWFQYAGGKIDTLQGTSLHAWSAMSLAENAINTDFRYHHGRTDPGPMRPAFIEAFGKHIATLGVPFKEKWHDMGHDLLYPVLRYGQLFEEVNKIRRNTHPSEVRVVTSDYRANRQHWVTVTSIEHFPSLARVRAVVDGPRVRIETSQTAALELALDAAPLADAERVSLEVDGQVVYDGKRASLGKTAALRKTDGRWGFGNATVQTPAPSKGTGSAGPITDAYFDSMLHVYGTGIASDTETLRNAAQVGARGSVLWLWRFAQRVIADTEVTDELLASHHVVLYGTPGSNRVLERIASKLPIRVERDGVLLGGQRLVSAGIGTKFIAPNPLAPKRYVIVQAAPTAAAVAAARNLPDFLPDFVVYDGSMTQVRPRLLFDARRQPVAMGYFDDGWRVDPTRARLRSDKVPRGNDPESAAHDAPTSPLPVLAALPLPAAPTTFLTEATTAAGKAAREIARRVLTFTNYRAKIRGATWKHDDGARWSIREADACLDELKTLGVPARTWDSPLDTPVPVPVHVHGPVDGVTFRFTHARSGVVVSCEMAARFADIARVVKRHGVHTVWVMSAYRDNPYTSFHTMGLALDLSRFDTAKQQLWVKTDFQIDRSAETCAGPEPKSEKARILKAIACELTATQRFSSVLTPNYNVGHRDHFHLDARPDDPRIFLR
jgi:poly(3-hydroxybutyrate) depolymerase